MLLGDLAGQCKQDPDKVIFLLEDTPKLEEPYISRVVGLRALGYRFAVGNLADPRAYNALLQYCSFFFLSHKDEERVALSKKTLPVLKKYYRELSLVATNVISADMLWRIQDDGYHFFESRFYKVPVTQGSHKVSPFKALSIRLINTVQDENFEFSHVANIVQSDPALTLSLLKMVNSPYLGLRNKIKTIGHAVAMLGQREVRKWVTTAVAQSLGTDQPGELTKIALIRAKFAENLAPLYQMTHMAQSLFLMGLFSVVDVMLNVPMDNALKLVMVTDVIKDALLNLSGMFSPVLGMIYDYENANWPAVSRHMIVNDISEEELSSAYQSALLWYRNLILMDDELFTEEPNFA